jgi:hypothetical protein
MHRFRVSGLAPLLVTCALAAFATPAWAQFQECPLPVNVPEDVFDTIVGDADVLFGELSDGVCNGIVNQGKATCRSRVKAAASCLKRSADAAYEIDVKLCNTLEASEVRSACKADAKDERDSVRAEVAAFKEEGLEVCSDEFVVFLGMECEGGLPK